VKRCSHSLTCSGLRRFSPAIERTSAARLVKCGFRTLPCYNETVKIPRDERPAPWFSRRDQYRLLALVGLLCLVMVAIQLAARPSSWYWLLPPDASQSASPSEESARQVPLEELDFRVREEAREPLPPDVFRAVALEDSQEGSSDADVVDSSAGQAAGREHAEGGSGGDTVINAFAAEDLSIPPIALAGIEDNTVGIRRAEVDVYHQMLATVRRLPEDLRRQHSDRDVAFTVIMLQPDEYRGRLVGITGELHRLSKLPVMENDVGIDQLYEGWMYTEDSGNNPWQFVCTSLPEGGDPKVLSLPRRIRVEGYFFKRTGYASRGGQHVAPTLLARSFELLPPPISAAPQMQSQMRNWMLGLIGLVIVGLGVLIWWFVAADRRYAGSRLHELATSRLDADPQELEALKDLDTRDPSQPFADQLEPDGD
jgi:hypothetical protein